MATALSKYCDVADFRDPELLAEVADILPERDPLAHVERKAWEFAMLARVLRSGGWLRPDAEVLGVGAGAERPLFWLARHVARVVATDVYGEGDFAEREADAVMLREPWRLAPFDYPHERLEVLRADARELPFEDRSFDVVYSLSSFEHFGGPAAWRAAAREVARVLRPGGVAFLAIDVFVRRSPLNAAPVDACVRAATLGWKRKNATLRRRGIVAEVLTLREVRRHVIEPSGLRALAPFDPTLSPETWDNLTLTEGREGRLTPRTGSFYPHVLLRADRSTFTSAAFALVKD